MPTINFEAILKLPPDERVSALKQLIVELQRLLKNKGGITVSKSEMEDTAALLERADEELAVLVKIKTPEKKTSIEDMFKSTKKKDVPLEEQVMDEPAVLQQKQEEQGVQYKVQDTSPSYQSETAEPKPAYETVNPQQEQEQRGQVQPNAYNKKEKEDSSGAKRFYKK